MSKRQRLNFDFLGLQKAYICFLIRFKCVWTILHHFKICQINEEYPYYIDTQNILHICDVCVQVHLPMYLPVNSRGGCGCLPLCRVSHWTGSFLFRLGWWAEFMGYTYLCHYPKPWLWHDFKWILDNGTQFLFLPCQVLIPPELSP